MSTITFDFRHHYVRGERRESEQIAYQWDLGHVMEVFVPEDATYTIGYCFGDYEKTEDYAIDTKVQDPDGGYKLTAHIPNKYFERSRELRVYVVGTADDHIITTYEGFITIRGRLMPDDYVDDDPENGATQIIEVAREYATKSESFAVGGTGTRLGEDTDNAKYYLEQAEEVAESIPEDYSELSDDVDQLKNSLITDSASGAIASFPDGGDGFAVRDLSVQLEPIQDLHGQANPYPAGGGVNQWDEEWEVGTIDISTGSNVDGNSNIRSKNYIPCIPDTSYYFNRANIAGNMFEYDENKNFIKVTSSPTIFTTSNTTHYLRFYIGSAYGTVYNHDISINYPSTDTAYHPYSNICPISGRTAVTVTRTGKNLASFVDNYGVDVNGTVTQFNGRYATIEPIKIDSTKQYKFYSSGANCIYSIFYNDRLVRRITGAVSGTTLDTSDGNKLFVCGYNTSAVTVADTTPMVLLVGESDTAYEPYQGQSIEIQLGQTVYGGTLDVTQGVLTVTHANITSYSGESLPSRWISSMDVYTEGGTPTTGAQVVYELATPVTVQVTAQQMTTLLGQNNVWSDADSVSVDYVADTKLYIAKVIADALS